MAEGSNYLQAWKLAKGREEMQKAQVAEQMAQAEDRKAKQQQYQSSQQRDAQFQQALQQGIPLPQLATAFPDKVDLLKKLADAPNFGRQAVARTVEGVDANNRPVTYQMDQYGQRIGDGIGQWKAPVSVNQGDRQTFIDPVTLQQRGSFGVNMSPSERDASARGWAGNAATLRGQDMTDARARDLNAAAQAANQIKLSDKAAEQDKAKANQVASFDVMLGSLDRLGKHPGLPRSVGMNSVFPTMPGSDSANFQAELNTFQSQAFLPMVAQLKGMGALSDAEGKKLTAAVGALDPKMGEKAFRASIDRIQKDMSAARGRLAGTEAGGATGDFGGQKPARTPVASGSYNGRKVIKYSDGSTEYAD